jgi:hypothetical protein
MLYIRIYPVGRVEFEASTPKNPTVAQITVIEKPYRVEHQNQPEWSTLYTGLRYHPIYIKPKNSNFH